jgi:nucleoside-diphosphate-sugar epimerase
MAVTDITARDRVRGVSSKGFIMRVFVTGASGWIASAVIPELLSVGHEVVGLARSDDAAAKVAARGATVLRGGLLDHDVLREGVEGADAVVHLGFSHDFSKHDEAIAMDRAAVELFGDLLAGSDRPYVFASGALGPIQTENDRLDLTKVASPRAATEQFALDFADRGIRSVAVRFAPTVHGEGDNGFMATLVAADQAAGRAAYIGDGSTTWPAVHRLDAGRLVRLALEKAQPGTVVHAIGESAIAQRTIAETIGAALNIPVVSITPDEATAHFGWLARFLAFGADVSSDITRETMGWEPTHNTLVEDIEAGYYFH